MNPLAPGARPSAPPLYYSGLMLLGMLGLLVGTALVFVSLCEDANASERLLLGLIGCVWGAAAVILLLARLVAIRLDGILAALKAGLRP